MELLGTIYNFDYTFSFRFAGFNIEIRHSLAGCISPEWSSGWCLSAINTQWRTFKHFSYKSGHIIKLIEIFCLLSCGLPVVSTYSECKDSNKLIYVRHSTFALYLPVISPGKPKALFLLHRRRPYPHYKYLVLVVPLRLIYT